MRRSLFAGILGAAAMSSCTGEPSMDALPPPAAPPAEITLRPDPEDAPAPEPAAWAAALPPLRFVNTRTRAEGSVRLYADDGSIDERAAATIDRMLAERDAEPRPLHRRVLQLVVKAANHFGAKEVLVVSSFRDNARKGSHHR